MGRGSPGEVVYLHKISEFSSSRISREKYQLKRPFKSRIAPIMVEVKLNKTETCLFQNKNNKAEPRASFKIIQEVFVCKKNPACGNYA